MNAKTFVPTTFRRMRSLIAFVVLVCAMAGQALADGVHLHNIRAAGEQISAKTQHLARQRPNKVRVPPKLYPIKKANYAQPTSNPAGQGMANGGFGVIISVE